MSIRTTPRTSVSIPPCQNEPSNLPLTISPVPSNCDRVGALPTGALLTLEVTLFGHGNRYLPYVIRAFEQAGERGLGRHHSRVSLQRVEQATDNAWQDILTADARLKPLPASVPATPPCPQRLSLILETPLRLKAEGRNLTQDRFQFAPLFSNLLRRISMLTTFHTDTPLATDFAGLSRAARTVAATRMRLRWHDWTRYSTRQDALMQLGGLLGDIDIAGADLTPFWPYLWLGQWTHAGKATSMGLGRYRIKM